MTDTFVERLRVPRHCIGQKCNTERFAAADRIAELEAEIVRLRRMLLEGPANAQECAEFCRAAREDDDGKPCLDCSCPAKTAPPT